MFDHTSRVCLDVEVCPNMPRAKRKAISGANFPILQHKSGFGGLTIEEIYRVFAEKLDRCFDRKTSHFDQRFEDTEEENKNSQRQARLQH